MKPEDINTAMHEAFPDLFTRPTGGTSYYYRNFGRLIPCINGNIYEDLNAIHEVEKVLGTLTYTGDEYRDNLEAICKRDWLKNHTIPFTVFATAAQRCEAFLRTLGKWVETKGEGE